MTGSKRQKPAPSPGRGGGGRGGRRGDELLLAVDAGNTHTVFGVYRGDELVESFRLSTDPERTADEYAATLMPLFQSTDLDPRSIGGVVVSSVVPPLQVHLDHLCRRYFRRAPMLVEPGVRTGMPILIDNPAEVGADRIVNSVAARERYGAPVVVVDFGTATTFDVVSAGGEYVGGIIAPGVTISAEALFAHGSRLYRVDIRRPEQLVGKNTRGAMQSGIYHGYIGLVDGILEKLKEELPGLETVVATGGLARLIASGSRYIGEVDPLLTLHGLRLIHERNR